MHYYYTVFKSFIIYYSSYFINLLGIFLLKHYEIRHDFFFEMFYKLHYFESIIRLIIDYYLHS
jgi:hypothetical protein